MKHTENKTIEAEIEKFREQFDHDNPDGKALVLIEFDEAVGHNMQKPIGDDVANFLRESLERVLKERTESLKKSLKGGIFTNKGICLVCQQDVLDNPHDEYCGVGKLYKYLKQEEKGV